MCYYGKPYWTKVVEIFLFKSGFFIQADISFSSWGFQLKARSFLFKLRCFNSSRNLFSSSWDVPIQVEIFSCRDFYFKSRIYFFMSRFLFQVEVFISCREFFHVDIFQFQEENFFFISSRDFCSLRGLSSGHFSIQGEMLPTSTCWHFLAMIKVIR